MELDTAKNIYLLNCEGHQYIVPLEDKSTPFKKRGISVFYKATNANGELFAIKQINKNSGVPDQTIKLEIDLLKDLRNHNEHFIPIVDAKEDTSCFYLVTPYYPTGSLSDFLANKQITSEKEGLYFLSEICKAIKALHLRNVILKDLNTDNILMESINNPVISIKYSVLLSRAGIKKLGNEDYKSLLKHSIAPEAITGEADSKADAYSLGCILYKMLTMNEYTLENHKGKPQNSLEVTWFGSIISNLSRKIMNGCLNPNKEDRMSVDQLLELLDAYSNKPYSRALNSTEYKIKNNGVVLSYMMMMPDIVPENKANANNYKNIMQYEPSMIPYTLNLPIQPIQRPICSIVSTSSIDILNDVMKNELSFLTQKNTKILSQFTIPNNIIISKQLNTFANTLESTYNKLKKHKLTTMCSDIYQLGKKSSKIKGSPTKAMEEAPIILEGLLRTKIESKGKKWDKCRVVVRAGIIQVYEEIHKGLLRDMILDKQLQILDYSKVDYKMILSLCRNVKALKFNCLTHEELDKWQSSILSAII